jgi:predicted GIY-YIG superfamily endonuclease
MRRRRRLKRRAESEKMTNMSQFTVFFKILFKMSTTIYVLRLAGGNWYVGKTDNFQKRMEEHVRGGGSAWTSIHKVLKVDKVVENASHFDEDRYVKEYMSKYGIDKVRGGSYVTEKLDSVAQTVLKREIHGATDCCTRCGRRNHFVSACYAKTDTSGRTIQMASKFQSGTGSGFKKNHYA